VALSFLQQWSLYPYVFVYFGKRRAKRPRRVEDDGGLRRIDPALQPSDDVQAIGGAHASGTAGSWETIFLPEVSGEVAPMIWHKNQYKNLMLEPMKVEGMEK
jgi:hypothetical protein